MYILFVSNNNIGSRIIKWWTQSEYSHVVLVENSVVISADFHGGVTKHSLFDFLPRYKSFQACTVEDLDDNKAWTFAENQIGKPYDCTAIFGFFFRRNWHETDSWFCSELVASSLIAGGIEAVRRESHRVSPQDLLNSPLLITVHSGS